jgi:hypothetical protein
MLYENKKTKALLVVFLILFSMLAVFLSVTVEARAQANNWLVFFVGGNSENVTFNEDTGNTYLYFTYSHDIQTIEIIGTTAIPEFPSLLILPLSLTITLVVTIYKNRLTKKPTRNHIWSLIAADC